MTHVTARVQPRTCSSRDTHRGCKFVWPPGRARAARWPWNLCPAGVGHWTTRKPAGAAPGGGLSLNRTLPQRALQKAFGRIGRLGCPPTCLDLTLALREGPDCQAVRWRGGPGSPAHRDPRGETAGGWTQTIQMHQRTLQLGRLGVRAAAMQGGPGEGLGWIPDVVQGGPYGQDARATAAWASGPRGCSPGRMLFSRTRVQVALLKVVSLVQLTT